VNKLIYVRPIKSRYHGEIGDVIVGRIVEVQADRWMVDFGGTQHASLSLGGITLPGNEQRRRMDEDKLQMRDYFREGDLISCEIQKLMESGEAVLHMRSNKYSALQNGQLVQVENSLIRRQPSHVLHLLSDSVFLVIGNNGWLWVGAPAKKTGHIQSINFTQQVNTYRCVEEETRLKIVSVRHAVLGLAAQLVEITIEAISAVLEISNGSPITPEIVKLARSKLQLST
jgi:exosome complex component RRP4